MGKGIIVTILGIIAFIFVAIPIIIAWWAEGEATNALLEAIGASPALIMLIGVLSIISLFVILKSKM
jgi:hypothetical protein